MGQWVGGWAGLCVLLGWWFAASWAVGIVAWQVGGLLGWWVVALVD